MILQSLERRITTWFIRRFSRRYNDYDVSYLLELLDASPRAFRRFSAVMRMSQLRESVPVACWMAARVAATRHEDCGACVQLVLDMAHEAGVPDTELRAWIDEDLAGMSAEARLGWRYAQSVLARDLAASGGYRAEIAARYGARGLATMALAVVSARSYPTLKYALGHGAQCQRLQMPA